MRTEDAILYRVDFDPSQSFVNRLTVMNHIEADGVPAYIGRMPNGKNSATSPDISLDGRWIYVADQIGHFYSFSVEDGSLVWMEPIGSSFGSPTTSQEIDEDGFFYLYAFGDHKLWVIGVDPGTGKIAINPSNGERIVHDLDYREHLTTNLWRSDKQEYSVEYLNRNNKPYERTALAASYVTATRDKLMCVFSVGWHDPDTPEITIVPTHSVIAFLDRKSVNQGLNPADTIEAASIDEMDTCEVSIRFSCKNELRTMIVYGAQSTTMAQFLDRNGKLVDGMEQLYVKPSGGIRIVEPSLVQDTFIQNWRLH